MTNSTNKNIFKKTQNRTGYCLLLIAIPFILYVFAFHYVPLFGWSYSVIDYKIGQKFLDFSQVKFVGLDNFMKLYNERNEVIRVLRNTLVMSLLHILVSPLPMLFAVMLNEIKNKRFKKLIQTTTTLPNFISWIIVFGLAWKK